MPRSLRRFSNNRRSWPARQVEQQRLAVAGGSGSTSDDSGSAAQRLLQLSQQYDSQAAGDRRQLTAEERLARIEMLLQQGGKRAFSSGQPAASAMCLQRWTTCCS
jgi:hypothetical protein